MSELKISVIQMNIQHGKPEKNREKAKSLIAVAAESKPDVLLLPEMWNTGYSLDNIQDISDLDGQPTLTELSASAKSFGVCIVGGSIANREKDMNGEVRLYNTSFVIDKSGSLLGKYNKIHLFKPMGEHNSFTGGKEHCVFELGGIKCGLIICYDLRFPELIRKLALNGIKVLFVPAEWPAVRMQHWVTLLRARAIENQIFVVAANRAGAADVAEFAGGSMIIDPWGEIISHCEGEEQILNGIIDLGIIDSIKSKINILEDRVPETYI